MVTSLVTHQRVTRLLFALVLVAGIGAFTAAGAAADHLIGVQNVTAVSQVTATESVVIVSWTPPTALQRLDLSWTTIRFGQDPFPMIVLDPTVHDVSVTDVAPGTYDVSVEFDYGPRSSYTHTRPGTARVTVARYVVPVAAPLAPTGVTATATGPPVEVAPPGTADGSAGSTRPTSNLVNLAVAIITIGILVGITTLTRALLHGRRSDATA